MMYIGWISNMKDAAEAFAYGSENQKKKAVEVWNTLFIEKIKVPIEKQDLQTFFQALKDIEKPSCLSFRIATKETTEVLCDALENVFISKCSNLGQIEFLYEQCSRFTGIGSKASNLLTEEWDRRCFVRIEEAKTLEEKEKILRKAPYYGKILDRYALHVIEYCDTLKKLSDLKGTVNGYTRYKWHQGAPEFEKLYVPKRQELLLKEVEEVSSCEEARAIFDLTREEDGALQILAFEKWVQFASGDKAELNKAYEKAPNDHCRLIAYGVFRKATA